MGGVFPGAPSLDHFWHLVEQGRDTCGAVPAGRWLLDPAQIRNAAHGAPDAVFTDRGCFIEGFAPDLTATGLPRNVAATLDPAFHLLLAAGQAAFAQARTATLDRSRVGVIIGSIALPTTGSSALCDEVLAPLFERQVLGRDVAARSIASNPLNRYVTGLPASLLAGSLGLGGSCYGLDAACASSLYAVKLACDELLAHRASAMLAGGLSRPDSLYTQMGFSQLRALSPSGRCSPFDVKGDGLIVGEGAGMVVLKRLSDALADGDQILGLIRGAGLSNDTEGNLLSPSTEGQLRALHAAYGQAGWSPDMVDLIECHATGTPVGDAVEFASLSRLWQGAKWRNGQCVLSAVKSNIGHLLTAAGSAGLIKTLLAMQHGTLPPVANFERPSDKVSLADSPFTILQQSQPWQRRGADVPRRAAVNGFGFGGINAHLLIEEWLGDAAGVSDAAARPRVPGRTVAPQSAATGAAVNTAAAVSALAEPVAIVGMGVHVGHWPDLNAFTQRVLDSDAVAPPVSRKAWRGVSAADIGAVWVNQKNGSESGFPGYYLNDLAVPLDRFHIPPREMAEMLPQQLLMLDVAKAALDDAGNPTLNSARSGVFIGLGLDLRTTDFYFRWSVKQRAAAWARAAGLAPDSVEAQQWAEQVCADAGLPLTADRTLGALGGIVASRVAREFHIGGPSHTICSEDTSGLRALDVAVRALQRGELDTVLAGAVDLNGDLRSLLATDAVRAYSREGCARPFDAAADGAVPGEGAACVVLKRLADAERDGDRVYAVIRGVGAANGDDAYAQALTQAYAEARVAPAAVQLVEAHGSGDQGEDALEARALSAFFNDAQRALACHLGSAKADVGHTGAACGLVSLIKASLCLYHEVIPGLRHLRTPRAELANALATELATAEGTAASAPVNPSAALALPRSARHWVRNRIDGPRRAGESAMSAEGGCMHVVLDAGAANQVTVGTTIGPAIGLTTSPRAAPGASFSREALFLLTAADAPALAAALRALEQLVRSAEGLPLDQIARQWWHARPGTLPDAAPGTHRLALLARDARQVLRLIESARGGAATALHAPVHGIEDRERVFAPRKAGTQAGSQAGSQAASPAASHPGRTAFVFPGTGNQFEGMGLELARQWPEVLRAQDVENQRLASQLCAERFWNGPLTPETLADHRALICGQVSFGTMVADLAVRFGITPAAAIGYSLGESTALFALRAWRQRDAMLERLSASPLFAHDLAGVPDVLRAAWQLPPQQSVAWVTGMVDRGVEAVRSAIGARRRVYVIIINSGDECVIGGDRVQVDEVIAALGCHWFALQGVSTVHCELAHPVRSAYRALHHAATTAPAEVEFYSAAWGRAYTPDDDTAADAIEAQALATVDFPRVIRAAYAAGVQTFIEIGPGNSCSRMIGSILKDRPHFAKSLAVAGQPAVTHFLRTLAQLYVEGVPVNLDLMYGAESASAPPPAGVSQQAAARRVTVSITGAPFPAYAGAQQQQAAEVLLEPVSEMHRQEPLPERVSGRFAAPAFAPASIPASVPASTPVTAAQPALAVATAAQFDDVMLHAAASAEQATVAAHQAYLRFSQGLAESLAQAVAAQVGLLESAARAGVTVAEPSGPVAWGGGNLPALVPSAPATSFVPAVSLAPDIPADGIPRALDRAACLEFGRGLVGRVLGPQFAAADAFPTRVRLPDEPLMLVDRITLIEGEPLSMTQGRVVTEHDIHAGAWYLDCGRIPTCIAVEAGQADLFLSGYLGIDLQTQGQAMYRLLDAKVCFHRSLPGAGEVIRYDIRIKHFFRQGDTWLFKFDFESTVNGEALLTMTDGCAGFFTQAALAAGRGIVHTALDLKPMAGKRAADWEVLTPVGVESYSAAQLDALRAGDLAACFGAAFAHLPLRHPVTLPDGRMKLVHRIAHLDPEGGRFGLGLVRGEADIHPDDWFLTCHFVDDRVMPGTLMFECCLHTLRVLLLRQGWVAEQGQVALEPVPGVTSTLKCRGQVLDTTQMVTYEVSVKEIGYGPEPYVIADALMYADGKPVVAIADMSLRYSGVTRETMRALWAGAGGAAPAASAGGAAPARVVSEKVPAGKKPALYDYDSILAFATGKPSDAFGAPYKIFDEGRVIARLPGPPFQFIDRITDIQAEPWKIVPGGTVEAQYDVPPDAWYFADNRQGDMPFAVLLEIALQPCGWLAAYMGSALTSEVDVSFRNLGGAATQFVPVFAGVGTLTIRVKLTRASSSAGMIIQFFDYAVHAGPVLVYQGDTYFGFFPKSALAKQEGLKDAKRYQPAAEAMARAQSLPFPHAAPFPHGRMRVLDHISCWLPDGGPHAQGFIRATRRVRPDEWFFKAHFYQDPVVPGSLGLESFVQLLKFIAIERWGSGPGVRHETVACGERHEWTYRGQVIPQDHEVTVEAVITTRDDAGCSLRADGFLTVDGRVIYAMKDFTLRQVPAPSFPA